MNSEHQFDRENVSRRLDAIGAEAAEWVARRDAGFGANTRARFRDWLNQDPRHAQAFMRADRTATEFDPPLHANSMNIILEGLMHRTGRRRAQRRTALGFASICMAATLMFWWYFPSREQLPTVPEESRLIVKAPSRQVLPDGSVIELDEEGAFTLDFSGEFRRVVLTAGAAHFDVAKQQRPFVVSAAGVTAQALGTVFSVELGSDKVSVLVTEGRVAVNRHLPAMTSQETPRQAAGPVGELALATLIAGKSVCVSIQPDSVRDIAVETVTERAIQDRLSWRIPRLEFTVTPLIEVITAFNRYNRVPFVIDEPSLELLPLSGVLRADRVEALIEILKADFNIKVVRESERILLQRG